MMLQPLGEHELLLFWIQLALLLAVARAFGGLATHFGQPSVIGELGAGLLIGPSVLGRIAPEASRWLFPGDAEQSAILLGVAWIGAFLLLVVTGFETDLALLSKLGRQSVFVSIGSLLVPLGMGIGIGFFMPSFFRGETGTPTTFALFIGVAMSISALPVVARILGDMNLMRRNIGQVIIAGAMANDLVGWLLLGVIAGIATSGKLEVGSLATTLISMTLFLVAIFTIGQRLVNGALRRSLRTGVLAGPLTISILVAAIAGAITHYIGLEAVLGAFVAGIVLGRSRYQTDEVQETLEVMSNAVFAPLFFATSGLFVDLGVLSEPPALYWAGIILLVAALTKLVGSSIGGWLGHLKARESLAIGVGLNARGAMEIVLATVALGLGVFNQRSYTVVVLMAMATSMAAPPVLRRLLRGVQPEPEEAERLDREELLSQSVIVRVRTALLPSRGGPNSIAAAHLLDLSLRPEATVTVLTVRPPKEGELPPEETPDPTEPLEEMGRVSRKEPGKGDLKRAERTLGAEEERLDPGRVGAGERPGSNDQDPQRKEPVADGDAPETAPGVLRVLSMFTGRTSELRVQRADSPAEAILGEAKLGYGLLALGLNEDFSGSHQLGTNVREVLAGAATPVLLVRRGLDVHGEVETRLKFQRIVVPATGTREGRAAEELAYNIASRTGARLDAVHVVSRADRLPEATLVGDDHPHATVGAVLRSSLDLARRFGQTAAGIVRTGQFAHEELLTAAIERRANLMVLGTQLRSHEDRPFLGHGVEYLLEHAPQTVAVVILPGESPAASSRTQEGQEQR